MRKEILLLSIALVLLPTISAAQFFLKQTMYEGESRNYTVGSYTYTITLTGVFDRTLQAQFEINGQKTKALTNDETDKLSDGAVIQVRSVLPQESGDGKDLVQFNFFPVEHNITATTPSKITKSDISTPAAPAANIEEPNVTSTQPLQAEGQETPVSEKLVVKDAEVDMTKRPPSLTFWQRIANWFRNLFK